MKRIFLTMMAVTMLAGACASDAPKGNDAKNDDIPRTSVAKCQTEQGAQAPTPAKGEDFTKQLKQAGVLNVGSDNAFPPFEEIKDGEPVGFDVDLYTEVATRMGLSAKSTTTDFDALFTTSIPNGTYDIGVSAITIKESRKQTVDFTRPYFRADLSLAVNTARTPDITGIDGLAGLTIGVQKGTTGADCAAVLVEEGKAKEVREYADAQLAFQDLIAGRVAAIVNDQPASEGFIKKNQDLKVVQIIETSEQYGFAISKTKPDLRVKIDEVLGEMMEDGAYARIYTTWFGTEPPFDLPIA